MTDICQSTCDRHLSIIHHECSLQLDKPFPQSPTHKLMILLITKHYRG